MDRTDKLVKYLSNAYDKDMNLAIEIRRNASECKNNISWNDINDLKIDLELFGITKEVM